MKKKKKNIIPEQTLTLFATFVVIALATLILLEKPTKTPSQRNLPTKNSPTPDPSPTTAPSPSQNKPPEISAGDDIFTHPNTKILLDGTTTDDRAPNKMLDTTWVQVSGPGTVLFEDHTRASTIAQIDKIGIYTLQLIAPNTPRGVSDEVIVTVRNSVNDAINIPGRIEAEDFKSGGQGITYYDSSQKNEGEVRYRLLDVDKGVDIAKTDDIGAGHYVGWVVEGEWLKFDLNILHSGIYNISSRVSSKHSGDRPFTLVLDKGTAQERILGQISNPSTASWTIWETSTLSEVNLPAGRHELYLYFEKSAINLNYLDILRK